MSDVDLMLGLATIASDQGEDPQRRLEAASQLERQFEKAHLIEPIYSLICAVLSRNLDDLRSHQLSNLTYRGLEKWRHLALTDETRLSKPHSLPSGVAAVAAQLLFESGRHDEALPFFERELDLSPQSSDLILACYNFEVLGRRRKDVSFVNKAIDLLSMKFKHLVEDQIYHAEVNHLLGHLYILKGRFSTSKSLGYEKLGIYHLANAAAEDPGYTSCYTFGHAEFGDFLSSIEMCLHAMRTKPYSSLPEYDAKLVDLELLFYLGYALMAVGEIERAHAYLGRFQREVESIGLLDARDHARLFLIKLDLKRRTIGDLSESTLKKAYGDLRSLSFKHALSTQMSEECARYEAIVDFLMDVARAKRTRGFDTRVLAGMGEKSLSLIRRLTAISPRILAGVRVGVGPASGAARSVTGLRKAIAERIDNEIGIDVSSIEGVNLLEASGSERKYSFVLWCQKFEADVDFLALSDRIIPVSDLKTGQGIEYLDRSCAIDTLLIGLAITAIKRYWNEDQYVFGIVPCLESPTIKFQHPELTIDRLIRRIRS